MHRVFFLCVCVCVCRRDRHSFRFLTMRTQVQSRAWQAYSNSESISPLFKLWGHLTPEISFEVQQNHSSSDSNVWRQPESQQWLQVLFLEFGPVVQSGMWIRVKPVHYDQPRDCTDYVVFFSAAIICQVWIYYLSVELYTCPCVRCWYQRLVDPKVLAVLQYIVDRGVMGHGPFQVELANAMIARSESLRRSTSLIEKVVFAHFYVCGRFS